MDCSTPGQPVHHQLLDVWISQARVLEWIAISFSKGSSRPRNWTQVSCTAGRFFTIWVTRKTPVKVCRWISIYSALKNEVLKYLLGSRILLLVYVLAPASIDDLAQNAKYLALSQSYWIRIYILIRCFLCRGFTCTSKFEKQWSRSFLR